ncbi:MAG: hypothetical protein JO142_04965 [Burkholderiales bacterium]|nr:hypothetical protein [Burkholderiales bacterium]
MTKRLILATALLLGLTGCDRLNELANQAKLNGRAIGAACRHSGRALEDCFQRNARVSKADIYAGWREMNEYMTKNKIDIVAPPPDKPLSRHGVASVEIGGGTDDATVPDKASADADKGTDAAKPADGTKADDGSKKPSDAGKANGNSPAN